jgi:hypothetical protein
MSIRSGCETAPQSVFTPDCIARSAGLLPGRAAPPSGALGPLPGPGAFVVFGAICGERVGQPAMHKPDPCNTGARRRSGHEEQLGAQRPTH